MPKGSGPKSQLDVVEEIKPQLILEILAMRSAGASIEKVTAYLNKRGVIIDRRAVRKWLTPQKVKEAFGG